MGMMIDVAFKLIEPGAVCVTISLITSESASRNDFRGAITVKLNRNRDRPEALSAMDSAGGNSVKSVICRLHSPRPHS